jgi:septal ring factor EnvC (AmiA/AmiB activator)
MITTVKNFFVKYYKIILAGLLGLFLLYWFIFILTPNNTMLREDRKQIKFLNNKIEEINKEQNSLELQIIELNKQVTQIETKVIRIKKDKIKVAKKYHEEIKRVDNYTELELDSFFANRYKK